jgi:hypothetical protein
VRKVNGSVNIPKNEFFQIIKYKLIIDIVVSAVTIVLFSFISFIFIFGKGHFEPLSSLWLFLFFFAGGYFVYNTINILVDYKSSTASILDCKEVNMILDGHKASYHVKYVDNNGQSNRIVLDAAEKRKPFRIFISETPIKIFYTKRTKIFLGLEQNGKVMWLFGKDK